jgi:hypothetical protein
VSPWSTGLADPWQYGYTDFGEGRGRLGLPVLRAVIGVSTPGASSTFSAIIDTGGPITVVAQELLATGGDPVSTGETMVLRLAGATTEVPLYEVTLEALPPRHHPDESAVQWRSLVAVLDPWPHQGTAIILGQSGFLDTFTVTFGPSGFVLELAGVFRDRFPEGTT